MSAPIFVRVLKLLNGELRSALIAALRSGTASSDM
jgi:hypothetical protein